MSRFGRTAWGRRRGGRLTAPERATMILALLGRRLRARFARRGEPATQLNEADIALTDSALTLAALAHCESECAPAVLNHSLSRYLQEVLAENPAFLPLGLRQRFG